MYITGCVGEWILITSLKWNKKQKGVNDNNNKINKVYPKANKKREGKMDQKYKWKERCKNR